jgi:acetyltransferase-like isoleucine patch superfamily enzyme
MTLVVADSARISPLADIEESVRGSLIEIGEEVVIDAFVKIKPAGGVGDLHIGARSQLNSGVVVYTGNGVIIGEDVLVAANVTFAPVNHEFSARDVPIRQQGFQPSRGGIVVEDDVWIGAGTVLLDGAIVRRGAVIAANSLVRDELEPYSVNAGNPSRVLGYRG